jgi:hypothetical protein
VCPADGNYSQLSYLSSSYVLNKLISLASWTKLTLHLTGGTQPMVNTTCFGSSVQINIAEFMLHFSYSQLRFNKIFILGSVTSNVLL